MICQGTTASAVVPSSAPSPAIMEIAGRQGVVVLREHAAAVRGDAARVTRSRRGGAAAGSLGLLLRVEEPPARSPSPLHCVLVPGFMEVRLDRGISVMLPSVYTKTCTWQRKQKIAEMTFSNRIMHGIPCGSSPAYFQPPVLHGAVSFGE